MIVRDYRMSIDSFIDFINRDEDHPQRLRYCSVLGVVFLCGRWVLVLAWVRLGAVVNSQWEVLRLRVGPPIHRRKRNDGELTLQFTVVPKTMAS